jgi:hypothetical protein
MQTLVSTSVRIRPSIRLPRSTYRWRHTRAYSLLLQKMLHFPCKKCRVLTDVTCERTAQHTYCLQ